ncbi:bromodomain associated protein [Rhizoctonia solani]|uniref:Bromodomain associated protein n=1 Tax=Rhizoctonia solani TaxID=456999 RepID=A0A8H8T371_9AGAM|nr:bromodomain associated protein [Rhizoctonia solani]QRW26308.1 bromodomain associated protein [Rhizoctonia solani]
MDGTAHQHLHRATLRVLHSHNFSSSSSLASHTLTALYAEYLDLLARSFAAHSHHGGRTNPSWPDAVNALSEVGVDVDELSTWLGTEAGEVGKNTSLRDEVQMREERGYWEAHCLLEHLSEGVVRGEPGIHLVYAQLPSPVQSDNEDEDEDSPYQVYTPDSKPVALPPSPISRSPSPASKRTRPNEWTTSPPDHIPDFLPPFPTTSPSTAPAPMPSTKLSRHKSVPSISSTGAIPYVRSALANASLPPLEAPVRSVPPKEISTITIPSVALREALSQHSTDPTPPFPFPQSTPGTNPARSKAARVLANALNQAFDASDSMFGAWGGVETGQPHGHGFGVPVLLDQQGELVLGKKGFDRVGSLATSGVGGRVIPREQDIGSVMGYLNSAILPLAHTFLAPSALHKITRIVPPQPLRDSADADKAQPMFYHTERSTIAPWCLPVPEADGGGPLNGTGEGLPEARLVPTWDWTAKDYESGLRRAKA